MNNTKNNIESAIRVLINDFKRNPNKYLTENDVRCVLVNKLIKIREFNELQSTEDGSRSIPIHTEVRWYGQYGKLKYRSDIVIVDVSTLRVRDGVIKLPSKGYGFNKPKAIIEIKFRRINGESSNEFIKKINKDINKLNRIKEQIEGDYFCCLVILDKKENIETKQDKFIGHGNLNIRYQYAQSEELS
jgi:hypothetical protein